MSIGDFDGRMAEPGLDRLGVDAGGDEQAGACVAGRVERAVG
jgi:hypothetical protein